MIARYLTLLLLPVLSACSDYREVSFNCTGNLNVQTTITAITLTESIPKVIGIYITESTKNPFNFWRDKTAVASVGNMLFANNQLTITEFGIAGNMEDNKDNFGDEVYQGFLLDRKTNILKTTTTRKRPNYKKEERFEGVCSPVK